MLFIHFLMFYLSMCFQLIWPNFYLIVYIVLHFPGDSCKESVCHYRKPRSCRFDCWVQKIPWRRKWQPNPVFLPGKPHRQRSLVGYSPWGRRVSLIPVSEKMSGKSAWRNLGLEGRALSCDYICLKLSGILLPRRDKSERLQRTWVWALTLPGTLMAI